MTKRNTPSNRTLAWGALALLVTAFSPEIVDVAKKAWNYPVAAFRPVAQKANEVYTDVGNSGNKFNGEYSRLTNEVAQVDAILGSSIPNAREIAQIRARTYLNSKGFDESSFSRPVVTFPVPGTKDYDIVRGAKHLSEVAGYSK